MRHHDGQAVELAVESIQQPSPLLAVPYQRITGRERSPAMADKLKVTQRSCIQQCQRDVAVEVKVGPKRRAEHTHGRVGELEFGYRVVEELYLVVRCSMQVAEHGVVVGIIELVIAGDTDDGSIGKQSARRVKSAASASQITRHQHQIGIDQASAYHLHDSRTIIGVPEL